MIIHSRRREVRHAPDREYRCSQLDRLGLSLPCSAVRGVHYALGKKRMEVNMALFVSALELFLGAVFCGVSSILKAALCAVKGAVFLVLAPIAPLVLLGYAGYSVSRGRTVQDFLDEIKEQSAFLERRRALGQFQHLLSAAAQALPQSVEIEEDSSTEPPLALKSPRSGPRAAGIAVERHNP